MQQLRTRTGYPHVVGADWHRRAGGAGLLAVPCAKIQDVAITGLMAVIMVIARLSVLGRGRGTWRAWLAVQITRFRE